MTIKRQVWVVEELIQRDKDGELTWEPTGEMDYSYNAGLGALERMKEDFPFVEHRLVRYIADD